MQRRKIKCSQGHTHYSNRRYRKCMRMRQKGVDYLPVCRCGTRHRNRRKFAKCNNKYEAIISPIHEPIEEQQSQYDNPQIKPLNFVPNLHAIQVEPPIKTTVLNQPQLNRSSQVSPQLSQIKSLSMNQCLFEKSRQQKLTDFRAFIRKCRQNQFSQIMSFVNSLKQVPNQHLFLSGPTGVGKTICIKDIINIVSKQSSYKLKVIYVNCMKLKSCEIFSQIFSMLFRERQNNYFAKIKLDSYFNNIPINQQNLNKLLIIDEIDTLFNKNQTQFYTIFQWNRRHNSKLGIISISNCIDISQYLPGNVSSRMQCRQLLFRAYTFQDLVQILSSKYSISNFNQEAFNFLIKKISQTTGDIRKFQEIFEKIMKMKVRPISIQQIQSKWNQYIPSIDDSFCTLSKFNLHLLYHVHRLCKPAGTCYDIDLSKSINQMIDIRYSLRQLSELGLIKLSNCYRKPFKCYCIRFIPNYNLQTYLEANEFDLMIYV